MMSSEELKAADAPAGAIPNSVDPERKLPELGKAKPEEPENQLRESGSEEGTGEEDSESESESDPEEPKLVSYKRNGQERFRKPRSKSNVLMMETTLRVKSIFWRVKLPSGKRIHEVFVLHGKQAGQLDHGDLVCIVLTEMMASPVYKKAVSGHEYAGIPKTSAFDFQRDLSKKIKCYVRSGIDSATKTWIKRPKGCEMPIPWVNTESGRLEELQRQMAISSVGSIKKKAEKKSEKKSAKHRSKKAKK
eukprot:292126_1